MNELGELEKRHEEFAKRNTRVIVASVEGLEDAQKTQSDFPHLRVVSDSDESLTAVADVIHKNSGPNSSDSTAPATLLIDRQGTVRWEYRPARITDRLPAPDLLAALDKHLSGEK